MTTDPTLEERAVAWFKEWVPKYLVAPREMFDNVSITWDGPQALAAEIRAAVEAERRLWMEAAGWTDSVFSDASMVPAAILAVLAQKKAGVALERAVTAIESLMSHDGPNYDDTPENHALADARDAVLALNPESQG